MPLLIGTAPNQVPTNGDLGKLAFEDSVMSQVPASATAVGTKGDIAQDNDYLYICISQNTWKRVAIATW